MVAAVETEVMPPETRGPGRPSLLTEALPIIIAAIEEGNSQENAARLAGIHAKTLSRWKGENEEFAEALARAEAVYIASVRKRLQACKTKWGTDDPKAIELETRRLAEFRQHQVTESSTTSTNLNVSVTLSADQLAGLQAMWQASMGIGAETGQIEGGK